MTTRRWQDVEGWWGEGDAQEYARLISSLPDEAEIVEIGCFKGRSLASVAEIIKAKKIKVIAVDIFGTVPTPDKDVQARSAGMLEEFRTTLRDFGLTDQVLTAIGNSVDQCRIAEGFGKTFDMVFIDGDHSYDAVLADLVSWAPLIKSQGILAGHDYGGGWTGVKKAVDEMFPTGIHLAGELWSVRA